MYHLIHHLLKFSVLCSWKHPKWLICLSGLPCEFSLNTCQAQGRQAAGAGGTELPGLSVKNASGPKEKEYRGPGVSEVRFSYVLTDWQNGIRETKALRRKIVISILSQTKETQSRPPNWNQSQIKLGHKKSLSLVNHDYSVYKSAQLFDDKLIPGNCSLPHFL